MRKRLAGAAPYLLIAAGVLALAAWWLLTRPRPSASECLERVVGEVAAGVEQHDLGAIMGAVSQSYRDPAGYDRREIWRQAVRYVASKHPTRVRITDFRAEAAGDLAVATMQVAVSARDEVTFDAELTVRFRREGFALWPRWRITSTEGWQDALERYRE